ncbi:unnamed protein product, partial [Discosporangium mesarthrocarpum]
TREKSEQCSERGNDLYRSGRFDEAVSEYTQALSSHGVTPTHPSLRKKTPKKTQEAAADCTASLRESPRNVKALIRRGLCQEALGRWKGAALDFR